MMLLNINKQLFARAVIPLKKTAINKNFNSDPQLAFDRLIMYEQKLSMRRSVSLKLFKRQPTLFKIQSQSNKIFEKKIQLIKSFGPKYQFLIDCAPYMKKVIYYMKDEDIKKIYEKCQEFEITEEQARKIFKNSPNVLNPMFSHIIDKKYQIFEQYMKLSKQQFLNFLIDAPYLISASQHSIRETVLFLVAEQPLTKQQILQFAKKFGDIFVLGRLYIQTILSTFKGWNISKKQIWKTIQTHPLLLLNEPKYILPKKIKIMRFFKFSKSMAKQVFQKYPDILLWSIQSLEAKLFFIRDRLDLPINSNTLPLLRYKFNETLRPRGQIIFKSKEKYNENNIESYMKMTERQFLDHFKRINHIDIIFNDEKARYPITREIDIKRNRRLKLAKRIPQILNMYIPYEIANGSYKQSKKQ